MPALQYSKEKKKDAATSDQDNALVASIRKLTPVSVPSSPLLPSSSLWGSVATRSKKLPPSLLPSLFDSQEKERFDYSTDKITINPSLPLPTTSQLITTKPKPF